MSTLAAGFFLTSDTGNGMDGTIERRAEQIVRRVHHHKRLAAIGLVYCTRVMRMPAWAMMVRPGSSKVERRAGATARAIMRA
jgi:hypothetical protein